VRVNGIVKTARMYRGASFNGPLGRFNMPRGMVFKRRFQGADNFVRVDIIAPNRHLL